MREDFNRDTGQYTGAAVSLSILSEWLTVFGLKSERLVN